MEKVTPIVYQGNVHYFCRYRQYFPFLLFLCTWQGDEEIAICVCIDFEAFESAFLNSTFYLHFSILRMASWSNYVFCGWDVIAGTMFLPFNSSVRNFVILQEFLHQDHDFWFCFLSVVPGWKLSHQMSSVWTLTKRIFFLGMFDKDLWYLLIGGWQWF
jgi:hypothetical protein